MTPDDLTSLLKDYGPWGLLAISLLSIRWMFGKFEASQQARIDDGKLYAGALKDAARVIEKSNKTSVDLAAEVSRLKLIYEHSRGGS